MKEAVEHCKAWCENAPMEKQNEINKLVFGMTAMYYRNVGEYDNAISMFRKTIELTSDVKYKLFSLAQIATIMQLNHSWTELRELYIEFAGLMNELQEPDENMAELYNILGIYYWKKGCFHKAQTQIDIAIDIGKKIGGENADITLKYKFNKALIKCDMGEFDEAYLQIDKLARIISSNPQCYPESRSVIFAGLIALSFENGLGSGRTSQLKRILNGMHVKYDIASNIVFKCNYYWNIIVSGNNYDFETEKLQVELKEYFERYPNGEGHLPFLMGECCRTFRENDILELHKTLEKMEECLSVGSVTGVSSGYVSYFIVKLKNLIYKKEYVMARKWLLSLWTEAIFPLFEMLVGKKEENTKKGRMLLQNYVSLFVSSARQYSQLKITDTELYECVLNYKCYEDAFLYRRSEFDLMIRDKKWFSVKDIKSGKNSAIVECFVYRKYDMEDINVLFGTGGDVSSSMYHICFGIETVSSLFQKYSVSIISDISYVALWEKMKEVVEKNEISQLERGTWNNLKKIVDGKKILYICVDISTIYIPLSAMRISENKYWCEMYQIIYCNTGGNVREDIEIQDIANSIYFGMSYFDGDIEGSTSKMEKRFTDLPYVEIEIEKLSKLTSGEMYIDESVPEIWFTNRQREIIYVSTHATECEDDGEKALLVGKDKNGEYICLKSSDIAELDWNGVKLVVLSACETNKESARNSNGYSLSQAVKKAGALYSISTTIEVDEGIASFFMVCFHKNLMKYKKIAKSFFETQKLMYTMTKKEILADKDYVDIGMDIFLKNFEEDDIPFMICNEWTCYVLQMN